MDEPAGQGPPTLPVVTAIFTAPGRRLPMRAQQMVVAEAGKGLVGDRYHGARHRHVTIQSAPLLDEAAEQLGHPVPPEGTRRNVTLSHGAVPTTPGTRVRIGQVELEVVRVAAPCRILDDEIAPGAAAALRRRAGTCFRVLVGGEISLGDAVRWGEEPVRG
ncbi:MOSC domain-containing protein [Nocardioidaceae bacterium]|nr:MOSC domain-containing protein [Nocardioidaceae bacterium]